MCSRNLSLPEQDKLCAEFGTACRYIELKTGGRFSTNWEKRLMVFDTNKHGAQLFIYKYFLLDICAGFGPDFMGLCRNEPIIIDSGMDFKILKPLIGHVCSLDNIIDLRINLKSDNHFYVKIKTKDSMTTFRFDKKEGTEWASAISNKSGQYLNHLTHSVAKKSISVETSPLLKNKEESEKYTGTRDGYKIQKDIASDEFQLNKTQKTGKTQNNDDIATYSATSENKTEIDQTNETDLGTQPDSIANSVEVKKWELAPTKKNDSNSEEGTTEHEKP